jgi:adenylate cyclase
MRWWARSPLRTRIFLAFSALVLAALAATLGITQFVIGREAERTLRHELVTTGQVFERLLRERATRMQTNSALLARDFALKRIIATYFDPESYDAATLASAAESYRARIGAELLWITDDGGKLLIGLPQPSGHAGLPSGIPPLKDALETGMGTTGISEIGGRLYQLVAVPVFAPDVIGYLVLGLPVDDAFARQLKEATGPHVSFLAGDRIFASSWDAESRERYLPPPESRRAMLQAADADRASLLTSGGERFLSLALPVGASLPQPLHAFMQGSYDRAIAPLRSLQRRIAAIGGAALLVALLIGIGIARGVTSPLQSLVSGMREVVQGNLAFRSRIERQDEIGFLARSFNDMVAGLEERARIKDTFGRFVSHEVAEAVLSGNVPLGGERRHVTILFQDIRGFTKLSESLDPAATLKLLNRFFTEVVAAVEAEGGVVKQFTGDGVMALFGAPQPHPDHVERAVRAGLGIVARLAGLNAELGRQEIAPLVIGVGIDSGEVVAGLIGPDSRVEYGVVGDAVNLANRVESLTKELRATVLVSRGIADRLGSAFLRGRATALPIKGRAEPLEVVEILAQQARASVYHGSRHPGGTMT